MREKQRQSSLPMESVEDLVLTDASPTPASSIITTPVSTACKSVQVKRSGELAMQRAERVAATKNLDPPSTPLPPHEFIVLATLPDDHLLLIVEYSCIRFNPANAPSIDPPHFLSVIRANELAQAKIAAARADVSVTPASQPYTTDIAGCGQAIPLPPPCWSQPP